MNDPHKRQSYAQRQLEANDLEQRLYPEQTQLIIERINWALQHPRQRWMFSEPTPKPPTLKRAILLWVRVVGAFVLLNNAIIEAVVGVSVRGRLPYDLIVPLYVTMALPLAVIAVANMMAELHVPRRRAAG